MARLWTSGAEGLDANAAIIDGTPTFTGTVTYDSGTVQSGLRSWKCDTTVSDVAATVNSPGFTPAQGTTYYFKFAIRFPAATLTALAGGSQTIGQLEITSAAGVRAVSVGINLSGVTRFTVGSDSGSITGTRRLVADTWYCVEMAAMQSASASSSYREVLINGSSLGSITTANSTTVSGAGAGIAKAGAVSAGAAGSQYAIYVDDLVLNDSTASAPVNTWPGDARVLVLVPASDNAVGTGWTDDAASATSIFDAVNVLAPRGIADTTGSTGLHQIRNATNNASVSYDANLTTYTAAGVGASDTVNTVQAFTSTAAPVTTSSKQGLVGMASNPAITTVALSATGTSGAFWSGVTAGTYPTGWKWSAGTMATAPTVTLGSAPVARVTQTTASTRIAMVDFLGAQIDYTTAYSNQILADVTVARTRT